MSQKSSKWLETQVLVLPPAAVSCGFICFLARSPQLQRGGVNRTWKRVLSLGRGNRLRRGTLGPAPRRSLRSGLEQVRKP